jgi:hypothetical protein
MKKWAIRIAVGLAGLLVLLVSAVLLAASLATGPGDRVTPSGRSRNEAVYLPMRDGVRIAVDVWYPQGLASDDEVPALVRATRYVRAFEPGILARALMAVGQFSPLGRDIATLNERGYVVVLVDARGSGASFGSRRIEWSPDEIADYGEVVDWIVAQPWSSGRVGAWGVSYEGNTADMLASTGREAVKAVAPLYDDFDPALNLVMPGGVLTSGFLEDWSNVVSAMDRNDFCGVTGVTGFECFVQSLFVTGTKPVDGDDGSSLLAQAVSEHENYDVFAAIRTLEFPRDQISGSGLSLLDVSPFSHREQMERYGTPMLVRVGWLDAGTVNVALSRFFTFENPQRLEIGPWSHGGSHHTDPFLPEDAETDPPSSVQFEELVAFFDRHLENEGAPAERIIRYYTMNEGVWKTTTEWPPADFSPRRWYFADEKKLAREAPSTDVGFDEYEVDPEATSGERTRWHTQLGGGDVVYPDRREEDEKLLVYTSEPLATEAEITGVPIVTLELSSTSEDVSLHVYLEDVAPDGRVTYLTEGIFRAVNRGISSSPPPYHLFGPHHTYRREDAEPLVPGEVAELSFELFGTSVRFSSGHRLRVAIAGADAGMFARVPEATPPTIAVHRSRSFSSFLELPMKELTTVR